MIEKPQSSSRWSVEQRLEFIDFRLYWEGRINRGDLVAHFGVSVPQASHDLAVYQAKSPVNALYDKTLKTYVASPKFRPIFFKPAADKYLAQLRLLASNLLANNEAWAISTRQYSIVPVLRRHIDEAALRRILQAIRSGDQVRIAYQSMSRVKPCERWIAPHALGFDGFRWHARAWCYERGKFLDFVLARILRAADSKSSTVAATDDIAWSREITLRFEPHPLLKGGRRKAIEMDYGMANGYAEITTRVCLSYYLERQFGLDRRSNTKLAHRHQIVLVNRDELEAARRTVGDGCDDDAGFDNT